jgi:AraC family transcriptional regulator
MRPSPNRLFVRGIAQAIAVHLARNYVALTEALHGETSSLPGFKLRRITDWMAEHMAEEFSLARLAEQAGMSEFHFNRLFKRARAFRRRSIKSNSEWTPRGASCAKRKGA